MGEPVGPERTVQAVVVHEAVAGDQDLESNEGDGKSEVWAKQQPHITVNKLVIGCGLSVLHMRHGVAESSGGRVVIGKVSLVWTGSHGCWCWFPRVAGCPMRGGPATTDLAPVEDFSITLQDFLLTILGWTTLPATLALTWSVSLPLPSATLLLLPGIVLLVRVVGTIAGEMVWGSTFEARFSLGVLTGFLVGAATVFPHVVLEDIGLRHLVVTRMLGWSPQTIINSFTVHRFNILADGFVVQAMVLHVTLFRCIVQELDRLDCFAEL
jgi:hypothetical protein